MSRVRTLVATEVLLVLGLLSFVGLAVFVQRIGGLDQPIELGPSLALLLSAVPALLWLAYFHSQDRHEPEPKHYVAGVYLLGGFVAGPVAAFMIARVLPGPGLTPSTWDLLSAPQLLQSVCVVGLVQELSKYLVVRYTVCLSDEFDEPMDGLIYMTAAGIGFATYENYHYLQGIGGSVYLASGAAHAVLTTLAHACFAGVLGYTLGKSWFGCRNVRTHTAVLLGGLLVAGALNGHFEIVTAKLVAAGTEVRPWRAVAYAAGFAGAVFAVILLLMRRLLAASPHKASPKEAKPKAAASKEAKPKAAASKEAKPKAAASKDAKPKAAASKEAKAEREPADGDDRHAPPGSRWNRGYDLAVPVICLALIAVSAVVYRSISTLPPVSHDHLGLSLQRPAGWLPPTPVVAAPSALSGLFTPEKQEEDRSLFGDLAAVLHSNAAPDPEPTPPPYHVVFQSPTSPLLRLEIRIAQRPEFNNLVSALSLERASRFGRNYWSQGSQVVNIRSRDWTRTRFRYAYTADATDSPNLATGIEYATVRGRLLYVVTFHGSDETGAQLAKEVADTMAISNEDITLPGPEGDL